jgi:hypothetical protein
MRGIQDACEQRDLCWVLSKHDFLPCIAAGVGGGRSLGRGISTRVRLTECMVIDLRLRELALLIRLERGLPCRAR